MSAPQKPRLRLRSDFQGRAKPKAPSRKKRPAPFCLRLTPDERAYLERKARNRPLGTYIRERLLGDRAEERREQRRPTIEQEQYAALLAALGSSRVSSNLNQLAKVANTGTLDVSQDLEQQLKEQNEHETRLAHERDQQEKDKLIFAQLDQRRRLQARMERLESFHETRKETLSQDVEKFREVQAGKRQVADFKAQMRSRSRSRGLGRDR